MNVDWEIHATAYRGQDERMTVAGIVSRSAQLGLTHIGIVDHLAPDRGWPAEGLKVLFADFEGLTVPSGLEVYRGAEVDIGEGGCLAGLTGLREELGLEYVIGSVHEGRSEGATDQEYVGRQFDLMMRVLHDPCPIDVLGHPWGGRLLSQVREPMLRDLLRAAARLGVGVEISGRFGAEQAHLEALIRRALEEGAKLAPASDAHAYDQLGDTVELEKLLVGAGVHARDLWFPAAPEAAP